MLERVACVLVFSFGMATACEEKEGDESDGEIDTVEECEDAGGEARASPGGPIACEEGEEEIGQIPQGSEGAICCRQVSD